MPDERLPSLSNVVSATVGPVVIDYSAGFPASPGNLLANGSAQFADTTARLNNNFSQAGSVFTTTRVNIRNWTNTFRIRLHEGTQPNPADGLTFTIQADPRGPLALAEGGGALGYGGLNAIVNSVAIKFDVFNNEGETDNSTGLFHSGNFPALPRGVAGQINVPLNAAVMNLRNQNVKRVQMDYDGTTLRVVITNETTGQSVTQNYTVDIPGRVGSNTAYVGFTGGTGGLYSLQDILTWRYAPTLPAAPSELRANLSGGADSGLSWRCTSSDEDGFRIERSTDNVNYVQIAQVGAGVTTYRDPNLNLGVYYYRVRSFNASGNSAYSNPTSLVIGPRVDVTYANFANPAGLQASGTAIFPGVTNPVGAFRNTQDIGAVGRAGSASFASGTYTLMGSGADIWGTADAFRYVYSPLRGNGEIILRVDSLQNTDFWAKGGVMIRETLAANSRHVSMFLTPHNESTMQWRDAAGGQSGSIDAGIGTAPIPGWVRLIRAGNLFTGFWSDNGTNWRQVGAHTTTMANDVFVGLALTSHNNAVLNTATFSNLALTGTIPPTGEPVAQLTAGNEFSAAGGIFTTQRVGIFNFNTSFVIQIQPGTSPPADGMMFVIQADARGAGAIGPSGGGLGYGSDNPGVIAPNRIQNSVGLKFDIFGESDNSTGMFTEGRSPTLPRIAGDTHINLAGTGIDFRSGRPFRVDVSYDGFTLFSTITDTANGATFRANYPVNLRQKLGGLTAHVGFTAGTGGLSATHLVRSWTGTYLNPVQPANRLDVAAVAGSVAGNTFQTTVTAFNGFNERAGSYRGTVQFTSTDPQATLPANYTFTAGDNGQRAFPVTLRTAGRQTITARDTTTGFIVGSTAVNVIAAEAAAFTVTNFTSPVTAGVASSFTATARDRFGNQTPTYVGGVEFTSTDPQATLPGISIFLPSDGGIRTFSGTLRTAGTQTITARDVRFGTIVGTSGNIIVNPAATAQFAVNEFPSPITAGTISTFRVAARDAFGNATPNYRGTVRFTSSDPRALLDQEYTFTAGDAGVRRFGALLRTAGLHSITTRDVVTGSIVGSQTNIRVNPAAASSLDVTGFPSPTTAGDANTFTVTARDAFGNVATGFLGTITFFSSDPGAFLPSDYTFTVLDNGSHTFAAVLVTAGSHYLLTHDYETGLLFGVQDGIVVNPAAAEFFQIDAPASVVAGMPFTFTVTALDRFGNIDFNYRGLVTFTSSDEMAGLPKDYTFTDEDGGVHEFEATLNTEGDQELTVADAENGVLGAAIITVESELPNPGGSDLVRRLTESGEWLTMLLGELDDALVLTLARKGR